MVKQLPDDIEFVFVGDGALRPQIEEELADKIDRGSVRLAGWVDHDEVPAFLNSFRLLVMTSRTEGVPTTALEAMACGTPVCATPVGGFRMSSTTAKRGGCSLKHRQQGWQHGSKTWFVTAITWWQRVRQRGLMSWKTIVSMLW